MAVFGALSSTNAALTKANIADGNMTSNELNPALFAIGIIIFIGVAIVLIVLSAWYYAILCNLVKNAKSPSPSLKTIAKQARTKLMPMVWTGIIMAILMIGICLLTGIIVYLVAVAVGLPAIAFLIIVPILILGFYLLFAMATAAMTPLAGTDAIRYSYNLVKNRWWRTLGRLLVMGIVIGLASGVVTQIFTAIVGTRGAPVVFLGFYLANVLTYFLESIVSVATIIMFFNYQETRPELLEKFIKAKQA